MNRKQPNKQRRPKDPSPEEIRRRCLEIQRGWNGVTERSRRVCHSPGVEIPKAGRATRLGGIDSCGDG
jgi:hypothetical protein